MRGRSSFVLLVIFGSFCVYCAQNVVGGNGGNGRGGAGGADGMVGNAGADTCCTPPDPPGGTILFDQKFDNSSCRSPAIDVAGNRTIVVHGAIQNVEWSFGGAAGWVAQSPTIASDQQVVVLDGRLGKQLRIEPALVCPGGACSCPPEASLTVVGYKQ